MTARKARMLKVGDRIEYIERTGAIVNGEVRGIRSEGLRVEWSETDTTGMVYYRGTMLACIRKATF